MKLTVHVPTTLNDGTPVSEATLEVIRQRLISLFGGMTSEGIVGGVWIDEGVTYLDKCERLFFVGDNSLYLDAVAVVKEVGKLLDQKSMYIEVQFFDGPQIIPTE